MPTHTGGIQPSSSFFHPGRPTQQPHYSPQTSFSEIVDEDSFSPFPSDPLDDSTTHVSLKAIKLSREPLLPVTCPHSRPSRVRPSSERSYGIEMGVDIPGISDGEGFEQLRSSRYSPQLPSGSSIRYFTSSPCPALHSRSYSPSLQTSIASPSPTPPPSFIARPPRPSAAQPYPLAQTPALQEGTAAQIRNFQLHPSQNRFFFRGRLLTGGDSPWAFLASFSLALLLSALWVSSTAVFWWHNGHAYRMVVFLGAYLTALVLSTMLTTASSDPGILPRELDLDPPYPATSPSDGGVRAPLPRDLRVRSQVVRVKYCGTCKIYRPPRSSHCKMCDNCVDDCDHHCQWVNNCIGRRNYTSFFALISSATVTLILMILTSSLHIYIISSQNHSFRRALSEKKGTGSAIVFSISIFVLWPIAALFAYHFRLLMLNSTTIEQIRNQAHKTIDPGAEKLQNPFSHGTRRRNVSAVLCRAGGYSWLNAPAIATEDRRVVNPGLVGVGADVIVQPR